MNKRERKQLEDKIVSVKETIKVLKLQETNLLEVIRLHHSDHPNQQQWVQEVFIGADYIVRLENSLVVMEQMLKPRRKDGGKKKD